MSDHIVKRHNKTLLLYHIVCPMKYRRSVITEEIGEGLKEIMKPKKTEITARTGVKKSLMITLVVSFMLLFACVGVEKESVGKWEVYESTLTTTNTYSNPYTDVTLSATFNGPGGTKITIGGFWDGEKGWKIRMAPVKTGTWRYITTSNDDQLNGKTGCFKCVSSGKKGFVKVNPEYPHTFMWDDGTPFFWLGETVWGWYTEDWLPFDSTFQNWVDTRKSQGFTVLQGTFYTANQGGEQAFGSVSDETLNPGFFQKVDKKMQYITDKEMCLLNMMDWSDGWKAGMSGEKYNRYVSYVVARYSAYNVVWGVLAEYEEIKDDEAVRAAGQFIKSIDPYPHLLTSHTINTTANSFGKDEWIDFHGQQQKGYDADYYNSYILSDRKYDKPVVNFEQCYEAQTGGYGCNDPESYRKSGWAILTGGGFFTYANNKTLGAENPPDWSAMNSQGAAEMGYIRAFWKGIEWWKMSPDNSLVTSGTGYCLVNPGKEYVVYLPNGGLVTIDLSGAGGTLEAEWFNPGEGTYSGKRSVDSGGIIEFTPPFSSDAVLHIVGK